MKRFYEYNIIELQRKSKQYNMMFTIYLVLLVFISIIAGVTTYDLLSNVDNFTTATGKLIYLITIIGIVNFFLMFFLWFVIESSYYKMLNLFNDTILYIKERDYNKTMIADEDGVKK